MISVGISLFNYKTEGFNRNVFTFDYHSVTSLKHDRFSQPKRVRILCVAGGVNGLPVCVTVMKP